MRSLVPLIVLLVASASVATAAPAIPPKLQAALYKRILAYDKTLTAKGVTKATITVIHADSGAAPDGLVSALSSAGFSVRTFGASQAATALNDTHVAYIMDGVPVSAFKTIAATKKVLTISSTADMVEAGDTAVGLGLKSDGRPQIIVHMQRLQDEGHSLAANLMSLARIIR